MFLNLGSNISLIPRELRLLGLGQFQSHFRPARGARRRAVAQPRVHSVRDALDLLFKRFVQLPQSFTASEIRGVPSHKEISTPRGIPALEPEHSSRRSPLSDIGKQKPPQLDDAGKPSPRDLFAR